MGVAEGMLSPVKNPSFFEDVSEVDVCIQKIRIQGHGLFEVMNGQPNFALGVENAPQVAPCDREIRSRLDRLEVASLFFVRNRRMERKEERKKKRESLVP